MKLIINLLIVQLLVLLINEIEVNCNEASVSYNDRNLKNLLIRKRRYTVFPPASGVLVTLQFTKTLMLTYPRGINVLAEADFYYPLQTVIADWYPKKKKPEELHDEVVEEPEDSQNDDTDQYIQSDEDIEPKSNVTSSKRYDYVEYPWWYDHHHDDPWRRTAANELQYDPLRPIIHYAVPKVSVIKTNNIKNFRQENLTIRQQSNRNYHPHRHRRDLYEHIGRLIES